MWTAADGKSWVCLFADVLQVFSLQRLRDDDLLLLPSDSRYRCALVVAQVFCCVTRV